MNLLQFVFVVVVFILLVELLGVILTLAASLFIVWFVYANFGVAAAQGAALLLAVVLLLSGISARR